VQLELPHNTRGVASLGTGVAVGLGVGDTFGAGVACGVEAFVSCGTDFSIPARKYIHTKITATSSKIDAF